MTLSLTTPTLRGAVAALLLCAGPAALALQTETLGGQDDEAAAALVGEMMFSADLLTSLDAMCPRGRPAPDWRAALPPLPPEATTPDLLDLSRRLAADAGQRLVQENGGCASRSFNKAYDESRESFGELIARWKQLEP